MADIQWKYYVGRGPQVEDIIDRAKKAWSDVKSARRALMEEYGANGLLTGDKYRYTVTGLLFYEKPGGDAVKCTLAEGKTASGRSYYIGKPNTNKNQGRILASKLASPSVTFDAGNELINLIGVSCMASITLDALDGGGTKVVWSSAEQVGNVVLVMLPATGGRSRILGTAPKIPPFLKLIKKEVYDALKAGNLDVLNTKSQAAAAARK